MDSGRPAAALKATASPVPAPRPPAPEKLVDSATVPMSPEAKVGKTSSRDDDTAAPLPLNKTFDSFDATLRLAAMTNQTEDFRDYITVTQKMRAYRGKIEPGSPLAAAAAAEAEAQAVAQAQAAATQAAATQAAATQAAATQAAAEAAAASQPKAEVRLPNPDMLRPRSLPSGMDTQTQRIGGGSNLFAIGAIVVLFILAVVLAIALVLK
jgi:hypothetical protein